MASPLFVLSAPLVPWLGSVGALAAVRGPVGPAGRPVLDGRPGRGCGPALRAAWACATSPTTGSASSRSSGRSRARSPRAGSSPSTARRASRPTSSAAACTSASGAGSTASTRCRWSRSRRARSATSTPATASRCQPSQTLGRVVACNNFQDARAFLVGEPTGREQRAGRRPARPAAGDPARRRLRDQPRAVRRHHRGHGLPPRRRQGQTRAQDAGRAGRTS